MSISVYKVMDVGGHCEYFDSISKIVEFLISKGRCVISLEGSEPNLEIVSVVERSAIKDDLLCDILPFNNWPVPGLVLLANKYNIAKLEEWLNGYRFASTVPYEFSISRVWIK
jgi:hypothetical protein